ncbi:MAG: SDR family oxidoreductase [Chloroflexi bacterium]|nr:SDR family oxidoreductase [Chloroflexota bacterium]MYJ57543.1 SDR family oxidoreductase [Chloroflexota bacterium]
MVEGRLSGKTCAVTGAASGIGRAIAVRLASDGAHVAAIDLNLAGALLVTEQIEAAGGAASAWESDVSQRASVRSTLEAIVQATGGLDVIFNNAGIAEIRPFMEVGEEHWNRLMTVNGLGVLICMQEAGRLMIEQGHGKMINTASIAGKEGYDIQPHYSATKFSVVALTQAGARAFAPHGITVNAICPGIVETQLWEGLDEDFMRFGITERPGEGMERFSERILLGRTATPEDMAGPAAFLASSDSDYITGQSLMVDGGMVLQ